VTEPKAGKKYNPDKYRDKYQYAIFFNFL